MKKILILYFSGVGATKRVAEIMHSRISLSCNADILSVESKDIPAIQDYDALIIGTPVYHAAPAKVLMYYLDTLPRLSKKAPVFIYSTRGLCSLNTHRIMAKKLQTKNIITVMDRVYRSPGSDGTLFIPFVKRFFEFEKDIDRKINQDCSDFLRLLDGGQMKGYIPKFRLGSIINAPNKAAGLLITVKIHLHKNKCIKCGLCIKKCPHKSFRADKNGYPVLDSKKCDNCYRCVHNCPNASLSLSKRRTPKKQLKYYS